MLEGRIIFESYDKESGVIESREEIVKIDIKTPKTIDEIGIEYKEQINISSKIIDQILKLQGPLINEYKYCPKCKSKVTKRGKTKAIVHLMNSDHEVVLQKYRCPKCDWTSSDSIRKIYGTDLHTSLIKLQAELGSSHSFRKTVSILEMLSLGKKRKINNKERIKRVVTKVGNAIEEYNKIKYNESKSSKAIGSLIVHIDGAHVRTNEKNKRSFEAMTATIFSPEDIEKKEGKSIINNKMCIASAKNDEQATMQEMLLNATKRKGMNQQTDVTALSDGASNCKKVINTLKTHCRELTIILDWFHIGMKFQNVLQALPEEYKEDLKSAKWKLWHGLSEDCLEKIRIIINKLDDNSIRNKVEKLLKYLESNKDILVNYELRNQNKQVFSSNVAESTVENLVNSRYRQTGKMQWGREGAHSLLQVRAAHYSNLLDKIWDFVLSKILPASL